MAGRPGTPVGRDAVDFNGTEEAERSAEFFESVRHRLAAYRAAGEPFDAAWARVLALARRMRPKAEGQTTSVALGATRHAWEAAYNGDDLDRHATAPARLHAGLEDLEAGVFAASAGFRADEWNGP